ncbi:MAG: DUF3316 domain-containing protein [Bacteroidales bacterium]|nr:DUF3316 domain-containing protein [Bacteroidales bacterium]
MKKAAILASVWLWASCVLMAQDIKSPLRVKPVNQSTLGGIGKVFLYDTYLSPLRYDGIAFSLLHDRLNGTSLADGSLLMQQQFRIQVAITDNPTSSASEYYGVVDYRINGLYPLLDAPRFRLLGGGGWDASLGGIYNVRNSNNPGSLKTSTNLNLTAMALYQWRDITFRWQLTTPFAGLFFSPEYGHSYYEIFTLGNSKGTIHLASFHNQQALRNYFTVDIPVRRFTVRAGYLGDYYRTRENQLVTQVISHQFMLGFAFESLNFGGKKEREKHRIKSIYY